jgi:hypothetical protein
MFSIALQGFSAMEKRRSSGALQNAKHVVVRRNAARFWSAAVLRRF